MEPSYSSGLAGGLLIGAAGVLLYLGLGRVAGVSGILGGILGGTGRDWRLPFAAGLLAAGALFRLLGLEIYAPVPRSLGVLAAAGLLVGFGTRLAGGCTSGHGVCGVGRFSRRSLAATAVFIAAGAATVFLIGAYAGRGL
jgi:uncharacterized protein